MNTQANTEVRDYLDRMREALADLPAAEVGEIMDDAEAHVAEVAEEMGDEFSPAALTARLGTPQAYAEELRVAAGYPSPSPSSDETGTRPTALARFALWSLVAGTVVAFGFGWSGGRGEEVVLLAGLCAAAATLLVFLQRGLLPEIARLPETAAVRDAVLRVERSDSRGVLRFLRAVQPVWWAGRALVIAAAGIVVYGSPTLLVVGLGLACLALLSGPLAKTDRRWLWISLPATGFALGLLLLIVGSLVSQLHYGSTAPVSYTPQTSAPSNIYVFDANGKPLTDVYLYDEDGRPLDTPWYGCDQSHREDNRYPRPRVVRDGAGCREVPGVPFAVVMPTSTPPSSTSPTGTPPTGTPPATTALPTSTSPVVTPTG